MNFNSEELQRLSFWWSSQLETYTPPLVRDLPEQADVVIVGAGFTGLWTAYYLHQQSPELKICVLEAEVPGFGASGRNGGWCFGETAGIHALLADSVTREAALHQHRAICATVDEVGDICAREHIDCHFQKGGMLNVALNDFQAKQLQEEIDELRRWGAPDEDLVWLSKSEADTRVGMDGAVGAQYNPHCAAIHPLRLVLGLTDVLESRGVDIIPYTPVLEIKPGSVITPRGTISCGRIVRATEGYTDSIKGHERIMVPVYSLMVATEPLSDEQWARIGLHQRETLTTPRRMVIYIQRTRDGRMAFGARGGYLYGSGRRRYFDQSEPQIQQVIAHLHELFPMLKGVRIDQGWGGMLGVPRSWAPAVSFDAGSGLGCAGGYVGDGVAASNLAARSLVDLMLDRETELTNLPWINGKHPRWEPEPLRWLGYSVARLCGEAADNFELREQRQAGLSGYLYKLIWG